MNNKDMKKKLKTLGLERKYDYYYLQMILLST